MYKVEYTQYDIDKLESELEHLRLYQQYSEEALDILRNAKDNLENELDQYKTAHNKLTAGLKEAVAESIKYKRERDSLIKDVKKLREEKNNLKHSVNDYKNTAEWYVANWQEYKALEHENRTLKSENKALRLQADEYFELWQNLESKHKKLTEHIRDKALNNPSEHRYFRLVHFIDEIEGDTHD